MLGRLGFGLGWGPSGATLRRPTALMTPSYESLRQAALDALSAQDARKAFLTFRPVLHYPGAPELAQPGLWKEAWELFARIAAAFAGEPFAALVRRVAERPDDPQALYDLGYQLIEQSQHGISATVLMRAHRLFPREESVLTELVAALEGVGYHEEAARVLRAAPQLVDNSLLCRFLLAYNSLMSGDREEPRKLFPGLEAMLARLNPKDEQTRSFTFMTGRLRQMLARVDALQPVSPLDSEDLRGWHFVVTGSVLLHLSPHGFSEGMRGRYAFVQDSAALCLQGIRRVEAVLAQTGRKPPRVFVLPERSSAILGHATARVLGLPAEPWPEKGNTAPGLVVAYDLSALDVPLLETLKAHQPGQVLWSHATPWTEEPPFAPDLTTYLYQVNLSPWGERMRFNAESKQSERVPPLGGPVEELAQGVVSAALEQGALEDLPVLNRLVAAMASLTGEAAGGLFREQGLRRRHFTDSPVKSNRFG